MNSSYIVIMLSHQIVLVVKWIFTAPIRCILQQLAQVTMATSQPNYKHNLQVLKQLTPGDLIEFSRGIYSHWGIYIGEEDVIHFSGIDNGRVQSRFTISGVQFDEAEVRIDNFWDVVGDSKAEKNNSKDAIWSPFSPQEILDRARSFLGRVKYNLETANCEHFAKWCRYGKWTSDQEEKAFHIARGVAVGAAGGLTLVACTRKQTNSRKSVLEQGNKWQLTVPQFTVFKYETFSVKMDADLKPNISQTLIHFCSDGKNFDLRIQRICLVRKTDPNIPIGVHDEEPDMTQSLDGLGLGVKFGTFNHTLNKALQWLQKQEAEDVTTRATKSRDIVSSSLLSGMLEVPSLFPIDGKEKEDMPVFMCETLNYHVSAGSTRQGFSDQTPVYPINAFYGQHLQTCTRLYFPTAYQDVQQWKPHNNEPAGGQDMPVFMCETLNYHVSAGSTRQGFSDQTPVYPINAFYGQHLQTCTRLYFPTAYQDVQQWKPHNNEPAGGQDMPVFMCETLNYHVSAGSTRQGFSDQTPVYPINAFYGQHLQTCTRLYFPTAYQDVQQWKPHNNEPAGGQDMPVFMCETLNYHVSAGSTRQGFSDQTPVYPINAFYGQHLQTCTRLYFPTAYQDVQQWKPHNNEPAGGQDMPVFMCETLNYHVSAGSTRQGFSDQTPVYPINAFYGQHLQTCTRLYFPTAYQDVQQWKPHNNEPAGGQGCSIS